MRRWMCWIVDCYLNGLDDLVSWYWDMMTEVNRSLDVLFVAVRECVDELINIGRRGR